MLDRVKEILGFHLTKNPGVKIVRVTTTRYYEISPGHSTPNDELLKEWFEDYPVSASHAGRDGSLLVEHFNFDEKIVTPPDYV